MAWSSLGNEGPKSLWSVGIPHLPPGTGGFEISVVDSDPIHVVAAEKGQSQPAAPTQHPLQDQELLFQAQLWIFLIPMALGFVQLGLFLEETGFFLRRLGTSHRTSLSLWILGVYPVFSVMSLISMYVPRASFVCNFVANLYHSITLWKFLDLVTDFFGGSARMIQHLQGQYVAPNPFPCCCCCCFPNIPTSGSSLRWMTMAVYQLSLIRTILFFITLTLWTDEKYDYGDVSYTNPNSYINAIISVSTLLSFYGYLLFYKATKPALAGYSLRSKFVCIVLVLVVCGLQSGILETMGALGAIPCWPPLSADTRSQIIYYYALVVEMFLISLFARYCFRRAELSSEGAPGTKNQASQTLALPTGSREDSTSLAGLTAPYSPNESLCQIEHTPLACFKFSPSSPGPGGGCGQAWPAGTPPSILQPGELKPGVPAKGSPPRQSNPPLSRAKNQPGAQDITTV
ncbi:organic solute transporter subunit alpha-like isoform X2 [Carettochelys insculpta]|uniref:organic solute transporter subunit alpha-like isoform X2 n=1 Tax=Carettochelys insculpta TaxID=44489 RepID=UPI003EBBB095